MRRKILSCMIFAAVLIIANTATSAVDCTCAFSIEKLNYSQGISLPYSKDFCEIEVTPNVLSKGTCSIPGHPVSTFTSSIEILSDDNHIISNIVGNKVYCENLPFGSSSIRLRYTISNGYKEAYQDTLDIGILRRYPPPTISAPGYAFNGWINRDVSVQIGSEPGDTVTYRINGGSSMPSNDFILQEEGIYTISATGSGGQFALTTTVTAKIDKTPPSTLVVTPRR